MNLILHVEISAEMIWHCVHIHPSVIHPHTMKVIIVHLFLLSVGLLLGGHLLSTNAQTVIIERDPIIATMVGLIDPVQLNSSVSKKEDLSSRESSFSCVTLRSLIDKYSGGQISLLLYKKLSKWSHQPSGRFQTMIIAWQ